MNVLPVMDLQGGHVVRGVGGRRNQYSSVSSCFCADARPATVARALVGTFGFSQVYVADLDAIEQAEPGWEAYCRIADCGLSLWLDAGIKNCVDAEPLLARAPAAVHGLIVATETLDCPDVLDALRARVGDDRLVFSLDMHEGHAVSRSPAWRRLDPRTILRIALDGGVRRFILLDLARVGSGAGAGTETLCRWLREQIPDGEIAAGGGIRHLADVTNLVAAGCDWVLVASALHDGRITADQIRGGRGRSPGSACSGT